MDSMVTFLSPTKGRRTRPLGSGHYSEEALASPEIHRWAFLLFFKLLAPSSMSFLANETPLKTILAIWYPIILSFYMLQRHQSQRLSIRGRANERRLWLHYWSMMASWQFLRRSIIDPSLQSTFGLFFLMPWQMKQTLLSSLAQLELCASLLLIYPMVYSKSWDGTILLTTASWNRSSFVYRMWERHVLSKIVTRETTLSLLSDALFGCFSASPHTNTNIDDGENGALSPADEQSQLGDTDEKENSFWTYLEKFTGKTYELVAQLIAVAQWFGLLSENTVTSAKALWSKASRVPSGLVLPPMILTVMPTTFCAKLGLQYLQWIYAASLSLKAASPHNSPKEMPRNCNQVDGHNSSTILSRNKREDNEETYWLQYWIIHTTVVFGGLDYVSSQLPFWFKGLVLWNFWLTAVWIWLLHDSRVVPSIFDMLAAELVGLGLVADPVDSNNTSRYILRGQDARSRTNISETNTARFAQYVLNQLPRASTSPDTERGSTMVVGEQHLAAGEKERSGANYPDLIAASSSLSSESSASFSPSSSPMASAKKSPGARESSALSSSPSSSTSSDCMIGTQTRSRTKQRRKKVLLRYQRHLRSQQSSPVKDLTKS